MSQNATSAPSLANFNACERPWPRAPPGIRTTLPSNLPMCSSSSSCGSAGQRASVDGEAVAGDVPGGVAEQPDQRARDVGRGDDLHQELVVQPTLVDVVGGEAELVGEPV